MALQPHQGDSHRSPRPVDRPQREATWSKRSRYNGAHCNKQYGCGPTPTRPPWTTDALLSNFQQDIYKLLDQATKVKRYWLNSVIIAREYKACSYGEKACHCTKRKTLCQWILACRGFKHSIYRKIMLLSCDNLHEALDTFCWRVHQDNLIG